MFFYIIKKMLSLLVLPVPFCVILSLAGMGIIWWGKRKTLGKVMATLAPLLLLTLSLPVVSTALVRPLEERYPPFDQSVGTAAARERIEYVIVLASGREMLPDRPSTSLMGNGEIVRLAEAARVHQLCTSSHIVLSRAYGAKGGTADDELSGYQFLVDLGISPDQIIVIGPSMDTDDEARNIAPVVGGAPTVLVTSAYHMPRSIALFSNQGLDPVAAPTGYHQKPYADVTPDWHFPNAYALYTSQVAIHEYVGIIYSRIRGLA